MYDERQEVALLMLLYTDNMRSINLRMECENIGSPEYRRLKMEWNRQSGLRQGVKELAYALGLISLNEYNLHPYDLIEKLKNE